MRDGRMLASISGMAVIAGCLLLTACGEMMGGGCDLYADARVDMPELSTLPDGAWGEWVADTDDRMTGGCLK